ncbi:phage tail tube protein [Thermomonospora cellulosilytica]|uniref:IPT/TIG domain-containing protein n=1 Tax=Thermomonospora cellulosilytica TaxID=1411118 RepID=A0A7W3R8F6_9ACTN|nr:IPT/TIG domain-containing protein [Thermomonospora cellulosilytica]MBA9003661.1 hypothetical protein [Thermomonospora cellulosilytica]
MANEITDLARRYRWQLNLGTEAVPDWQTVMGTVEFKPTVDPTIQDDSDYESNGWKGNTKTAQAWKIEAKISHKYDPDTLAYHPTHDALEAASEAFGADSRIQVRYFDRSGKGTGRQGWALVTWAPEGGDTEQLDRVTVTLTGDGPLTSIANPVNATPAPIVSAVSPASGPAAGGDLVIITGANFTGATDVEFDDVNVTDFTVVSSTQIAAITPAGSAGPANVDVTTPNGTGTGTAAYTYV